MKLIAFTRDMRPHVAGETRVVPDEIAAKLIAMGDAALRPSIYDSQPAEAPKPRGYLTRLAPSIARARKAR